MQHPILLHLDQQNKKVGKWR